MTEPTQPDDNTLAYAGISLFGNTTKGAAPEWHELSAWRAGNLPPDRSAQILSHIANDPDYFQQWLDLVEAEQWVAEEDSSLQRSTNTTEQHDTLSDSGISSPRPGPGNSPIKKWVTTASHWFRSLFQQPIYGGALAAVLLAVLIVPLMRETQPISLQQQLDRSMDTYIDSYSQLPASTPAKSNTRNLGALFDELSISDVERHYFQYGLRSAAETMTGTEEPNWQLWLSDLPANLPDCSKALDNQHCVDAAEDFTVLGQWSLLTYASCVSSASAAATNTEFWQLQAALYEQLASRSALQSSVLFGSELSTLPDNSAQALCSVADQLLSKGQ